ncbi:MAG TPA: universal stress protein [Gammaproteobacteria bacterium]|nr:universal stress protein [Gammaproteobacteria bacterium]
MYERILVCVDASTVSDRALKEAAKLARGCGARLRLIHVTDEVNLGLETEQAAEEFTRKQLDSGTQVMEHARQVAREAGVEPETRLAELTAVGKRPAHMILEEASQWPADLVVMGTHGRRGLSHLLLGSVAENVLRHATVPLLLVKDG